MKLNKSRMKLNLIVGLFLIKHIFTLETERSEKRRESRKLFGGYRITPKHCKPSQKASTAGPTVCMFNHECARRNGLVVGTCMDGFLFGACCQLSEDLVGQLTIDEINSAHNPSNSLSNNKEDTEHPSTYFPFTSPVDEIALDGVSKITAALLRPDIILTAEENGTFPMGNFHAHFSTTGVTHPTAPDTVILHQNDKDNSINPDVFNKPVDQKLPAENRKTTVKLPETTPSYQYSPPYIQIAISNSPIGYGSTAGPKKPVFRPKPSSDADKYVLVPTITHTPNPNKTNEMDNEPSPTSFYQNIATTGGMTKTPLSSYVYGSTVSKKPTLTTWLTTLKDPATSYVYSSTPLPPRPTTVNINTKATSKPLKFSSSKPFSTVTYGGSSKEPIYQKISSTTSRPSHSTFSVSPEAFYTTRRPPSTSYVYSTSFSKRPTVVYGMSNSFYSSPSTSSQYSSSTYTSPPPTIIVLGPSEEYSSPQPLSSSVTQSPLQRPVTQVTINNHVSNSIYGNEHSPSPSVLITPKPSSQTAKPLRRPTTEYIPTGESETSVNNDLINFPPVRNPNLNMSVPLDDDITTPFFIEDEALHSKIESFFDKIVQGLQEPFQGLTEVVSNKSTVVETTTKKTTKKTSTKKPTTNAKPPTRRATTKKPTAGVTTKRPATTTKRSTPVRRVTTTTPSYIETVAPSINTSDYRHVCGLRPLVKSGRIVGGKKAAFGAFPWQVLVRESTWLGLFTKNKCGGVLISNKYVMTAAHCQPGFLASLVVVLGEHDISGEKEKKRSVTRNVKNIIVHNKYDPATFENDLALLELEHPVAFDEHIIPICLPKEGADFTGRMATVTGWGRLQYTGGVPSILQEVQVPIMENHVCQEMFKTAGQKKIIRESFLCAGYANGQKDSCEGDSGGPLVLQRPDGRYELAGTVSHGVKCAAPYLPGVYMRTAYFKPWLESVTGVH